MTLDEQSLETMTTHDYFNLRLPAIEAVKTLFYISGKYKSSFSNDDMAILINTFVHLGVALRLTEKNNESIGKFLRKINEELD